MLGAGILRSKLWRRLLGFVLGAAVGLGVLVTVKRPEKSLPLVNKDVVNEDVDRERDGYWLPLFVHALGGDVTLEAKIDNTAV